MGQHSLTYGSQYEVPRSASHRNLLEMQFLGPPPQTSWVRNSLKMDLITNTSFENTVSIKYTKNRLLRKKEQERAFEDLKWGPRWKKRKEGLEGKVEEISLKNEIKRQINWKQDKDKKIKEAIRVVGWEGHLTGKEITMGGVRLGRRGWVLALVLSKVCTLGSWGGTSKADWERAARKFGVPEAKRMENFKIEEVISCVKWVSKRDGHCFKATQWWTAHSEQTKHGLASIFSQ